MSRDEEAESGLELRSWLDGAAVPKVDRRGGRLLQRGTVECSFVPSSLCFQSSSHDN